MLEGAEVAVAVGSGVEVGDCVGVAVAGGRADTATRSETGVAVGDGDCANTHPTARNPIVAETSDARFITTANRPNTPTKNYSKFKIRQL